MTTVSATQTATPTNTTKVDFFFNDATSAAKRLDTKASGRANGNGHVSLGELKKSMVDAQSDDDTKNMTKQEAKHWYANTRGLDEDKMSLQDSAQFEKFWEQNARAYGEKDKQINVDTFVKNAGTYIQGNNPNKLNAKKEFSDGEFDNFYKHVLAPEAIAEAERKEPEGLSELQQQQVEVIAQLKADKLRYDLANGNANVENSKKGDKKEIKNDRIEAHEQHLETARRLGVPTEGYEDFDRRVVDKKKG